MNEPDTIPNQTGSDELVADIITKVFSGLDERHPAFARGWYEPVYNKKIHIGDTCQHCGTHFKGLRDDIKTSIEYYAKQAIQDEITRARLNEAHLWNLMCSERDIERVTHEYFVNKRDERIDKLQAALKAQTTQEESK